MSRGGGVCHNFCMACKRQGLADVAVDQML